MAFGKNERGGEGPSTTPTTTPRSFLLNVKTKNHEGERWKGLHDENEKVLALWGSPLEESSRAPGSE